VTGGARAAGDRPGLQHAAGGARNRGRERFLRAEGVGVVRQGRQVLQDVHLEVFTGEVLVLVGPNGAGKTTLFNVVTGLLSPTSGRVRFDGRDVSRLDTHKRARLGIARTFQKLEAFSNLSAFDNVLVAAEMRRKWDKSKFDPRTEALSLLDKVGIANVANFMVGTLPTGTARLVELARALATNPRVLLLDEPSSGLNEEETEGMASLLRMLVADGLGVLLVEHDMAFVMSTCEFIHVLDFGTIIATGSPLEVQANPAVQAAYLGAAVTEGAA
jgi:branched-chain amino acid transport system ATP-binding protein